MGWFLNLILRIIFGRKYGKKYRGAGDDEHNNQYTGD